MNILIFLMVQFLLIKGPMSPGEENPGTEAVWLEAEYHDKVRDQLELLQSITPKSCINLKSFLASLSVSVCRQRWGGQVGSQVMVSKGRITTFLKMREEYIRGYYSRGLVSLQWAGWKWGSVKDVSDIGRGLAMSSDADEERVRKMSRE